MATPLPTASGSDRSRTSSASWRPGREIEEAMPMHHNASAPPAAATAAEIGRRCELGDEAHALLRDHLRPEAYLDLLGQKELYPDAIRFTAQWLSKQAAVWWGCLCTWEVCRPQPPGPIAAALKAAVHWVQDPSEENRRAAEAAGEAAGPGTPAGAVALAAFWSGGNMSRADLPQVPPPPLLTGTTIAAAVLLAAAQSPTPAAVSCCRFLQLGREVAAGQNRWE